MRPDGCSDHAPGLRLGSTEDYVVVCLSDGVLTITVTGAPTGGLIHDAILAGLQQGWLQPGVPTLVDVRGFRGNVDWQSMLAISRMTDWSKGGTLVTKVAYLTSDSLFSLLVKAVSTLFPASRHRLFAEPDAARQWLVSGSSVQG